MTAPRVYEDAASKYLQVVDPNYESPVSAFYEGDGAAAYLGAPVALAGYGSVPGGQPLPPGYVPAGAPMSGYGSVPGGQPLPPGYVPAGAPMPGYGNAGAGQPLPPGYVGAGAPPPGYDRVEWPAGQAPVAPPLPEPLNRPSAGNFSQWQKDQGRWFHARHLAQGTSNEAEDASGNVRYLDEQKRRKYEVVLGDVITRRATGVPLDTASVFQHYRAERNDIGRAHLGANRAGKAFRLPQEWQNKALIWVCAPNPETGRPAFYTHVCKVGRFHHSSFNAGGGVIGAGEWVVVQGRLKYISANSGHYRPDLHAFSHAVLNMGAAFGADTAVLMYDSVDDAWVHRPVRDFIREPSAGGRYKTHPDAV